MFLPPGQAVAVEFQAQAGANAIALESPIAVVVRDGVDTAVVTAIATQGSGRYVVSFTVPSNWVFPQRVSVRLSGSFNGLSAQLTKAIGQVGDPVSQVAWLTRRQGLGTSATVKDAVPGTPGYLVTGDGIEQVLTMLEDGAVRIEDA